MALQSFPTRFLSFLVTSVRLLVHVTMVDKNKAVVCCGIPWVNCAVLCVKDDWKGQLWALRYCVSKLRSLLSSPSGMTSHSKIAQFNWEYIARLRMISGVRKTPSATIRSAAHVFVTAALAHLSFWCRTVPRSFVSSTFLCDAEATFLLLILGKWEFGVAKWFKVQARSREKWLHALQLKVFFLEGGGGTRTSLVSGLLVCS